MPELIIWSIAIALLPYAIWRRKEKLLYACAVLSIVLIIPIMIGLNTPNPDWVQVIAVTTK